MNNGIRLKNWYLCEYIGQNLFDEAKLQQNKLILEVSVDTQC